MDYPLWHGAIPMRFFLEQAMSPERLLVEGAGIRVRDARGRWYIDARSGCWNCSLGYSAAEVKKAIGDQLTALPDANTLVYDRPAQVTLDYARALRDAVGSALPYVRLGNTGTQMTETAVMLSRFARVLSGEPDRTIVLSFAGSYHGFGINGAALSGFIPPLEQAGPLAPDLQHVPAEGSWADNVRERLAQLSADRVTAVMIEPQMGLLGLVPEPDDLRALARLCRDAGVHLIADEVSTGWGRCGAMSRCLELGIEPDMLVLAKGLTSGYVPVGALLVTETLWELAAAPGQPVFLPAGSATDGHPVACAAGLAVLEVFRRDGVLDNVRGVGAALKSRLTEVKDKRLGSSAGAVRGEGLMIHFPLSDSSGRPWPRELREWVRVACEENGVLLSTSEMGCWILPPLVCTEDDGAEIAGALDAALDTVMSSVEVP
ncbi:aminotransferase class III-fold pyridoxal phosphate-dependent enzyme [Actinoallomurus sp. NPDC050550]|uniref:aminotransferase class III-fold pyridoxal phosphate-dependent enzyme n=1 Tax=Actinoallomurus sp. NPDC050550 TaxID=3154937 RepID=UPI0033D9ACC7